MNPESHSLLRLGRALRREAYCFVTVTPETHRRVNARAASRGMLEARNLRDVFGWNRPFDGGLLPRELFAMLRDANALSTDGDLFRSRVRFSSLNDRLFVHTSFPTEETDAVFFGPDTYRFCALLRRSAPSVQRAVDVGCGSGAGGISLAPRTKRLILSDINEKALDFSRINAALNGVQAEIVASDVLDDISGELDLVVANPPYMRDEQKRLYRDGGGAHGEGLAVRIVRESLPRLANHGTLLLYTGSAIVEGADTFFRGVEPLLHQLDAEVGYEVLDPDVFGDELERPDCAEVDRIAAVALRVAMRPTRRQARGSVRKPAPAESIEHTAGLRTIEGYRQLPG